MKNAYLVGGPMDLTKMAVQDEAVELVFPTNKQADPSLHFPSDGLVSVKYHHYRRILHEYDREFMMYYYEGTW